MRDKKFFDIKHARFRSPTPRVVRVFRDIPYIPIGQPIVRRRRTPLIVLLSVFLVAFAFFGLNLFDFKKRAADSAPGISFDFKEGARALFGFDLEKARSSFDAANKQLTDLTAHAPLGAVPVILEDLFRLSQVAGDFSAGLEDLRSNGLSMLIGKEGAFLIQKFQNLKNQLADVGTLSAQLEDQAAKFNYSLGTEFSGLKEKLGQTDKFLAAFLDWLEIPKKQRLLILFQNPSEMRPGGGFIGSYGVATLFQGNLLDLSVRDIYDPDGQLDLKVIPPKPLQGVTGSWGARDANWFFDFPTSAKKAVQFLEASKIYSEQNIKFGGVVAINVEVVKDILDAVGPVPLPNYGLTIDSGNLLPEIQKEVEVGADKARGEPKRILKVLTPIIFEKLAGLSAGQRGQIFSRLAERFSSKDIMVYFPDPAVEDYLKKVNAAGEVLQLPDNTFGDYLAVVNASVGGGKSDAVIRQKFDLISKFETDGRIRDLLTVTRVHDGSREKEWWYRATNHDYLQIFVPDRANLVKISGASPKKITPLADYSGKSFAQDADLAEIESSGAFLGKKIFSAWLETKAGEAKEIRFDYYTPKRFNFQPGPYQFVFEKQSGAKGELNLELEAPPGFRWKESGSPEFIYSAKDLPGRLVLNLNLEAGPR